MERQTTRVLIADDEAATRSVLASAVLRAGFSPVLANDGAEALTLLRGPSAPRIALLDWVMPKVDGVEVCRQIRRQPGPRTFVLMISGRSRHESVLEGFEAGVDGFIPKPFHPGEVVARLRACERSLELDEPRGCQVERALAEGLMSCVGGEVVVRKGEVVGKLLLHEGGIAWVHLSNDPSGLQGALKAEGTVSPGDLHAVFEECRRTGENVLDLLVSWGLIEAASLREVIRRLFARRLEALVALESPSVIFVPEPRAYSGTMRFAASELLPRSGGAALPVPAPPPSGTRPISIVPRSFDHGLLERAMSLDGALSVALVDRRTGQLLATVGERVDGDVLLTGARLCHLMPEADAIEDVLLTSSHHYHLLRAVPSSPELLVYMRLARARTSLAMARFHLTDLARLLA
jgi:CheY-like chemotaxis protein